MRVFFMLLIFAIGFSGYSAAAHAFSQDDCAPTSVSEAKDQQTDMSDCPGHKGGKNIKSDTESGKTSKAKCLDCSHCCMAHVTLNQNYTVPLPPLTGILSPSHESGKARESLFSQLRPPRHFV